MAIRIAGEPQDTPVAGVEADEPEGDWWADDDFGVSSMYDDMVNDFAREAEEQMLGRPLFPNEY